MAIYEKIWFSNFITWCRKWKWFDTYIYGKSINLEDFCRNPAEIFAQTYFPMALLGVKGYSIFNIRMGYLPASDNVDVPKCFTVPMGEHKLVWRGKEWVYADLRAFNKFFTKFCNSMFFFQLAASVWHYIPFPYIGLCIKIAPWYFQFGIGWAAETNDNSYFSAKLRFVNEITSNETTWNPSDVIGYYEGVI